MDPNYIINLIAQIPFLAAFIWYFDRATRQFQEFLREERTAREQNAKDERAARERFEEKIMNRFDNMDDRHEKHDEEFRRAIAVMEERTKPTKPQPRRTP